ncbi:hypothetical protein LCGC14_0297800 [marine sediment metagenome]|uniref:Uncharacterized protein n=1 Tax=marine sediment metagenome TaxID=412755 RepID=A0A0F9WCI7_9ZZZZ
MAIEPLDGYGMDVERGYPDNTKIDRVLITERNMLVFMDKLNELVKVVNKMQAMMNSKLPSGVEHNLQEQPNDPK